MHWIDRVLNSSILTRITEALKQSRVRMTKKCAQILSAIGSFNRPFTAEEIRKHAGLPSRDRVTVYRNLEAFESLQALRRTPMASTT
jgi:Fe2+ or Zn2+ uptake regulation protein